MTRRCLPGPRVSHPRACGVIGRKAAAVHGNGLGRDPCGGSFMNGVRYFTRTSSPLGPLLLVGTGDALTAIRLPGERDGLEPDPSWIEQAAPFADAVRQLGAYFAGTLRRFDLRLAPAGTRVPATGLASADRDPLRPDDLLRGAGAPDRPTGGRAGRGRRQRQESAGDRHPVPPGHRKRRPAGRVWRRTAGQGRAARPRARRRSAGATARLAPGRAVQLTVEGAHDVRP